MSLVTEKGKYCTHLRGPWSVEMHMKDKLTTGNSLCRFTIIMPDQSDCLNITYKLCVVTVCTFCCSFRERLNCGGAGTDCSKVSHMVPLHYQLAVLADVSLLLFNLQCAGTEIFPLCPWQFSVLKNFAWIYKHLGNTRLTCSSLTRFLSFF